ncbi:monovalent cation/H(+) antiporter subunit G [Streptomyces sp. SPB162]|uniref:monovalent cation/H(+) antiporter subunit G n=1 Tax=Streptomyces sp. SPB162 TaxID=2940560 RepID=UPI0024051581|nr:monovalent cation/H(+) antiporter subunit G [Streptomyces sp. SPB162]MDF9813413.1 multicomponent Na+:H+ antiporter subunit G [Streptomyces sp. SPB162]
MTPGAVCDWAAAVCLLLGAALCFVAGIGLLRLPDTLTRMHAATKPQVLGLLLVLLGVALRLRSWVDLGTLVLIGTFQLTTVPVAAHLVGRAAYRTGQVRADRLVLDELDDHLTRPGAGPGPG